MAFFMAGFLAAFFIERFIAIFESGVLFLAKLINEILYFYLILFLKICCMRFEKRCLRLRIIAIEIHPSPNNPKLINKNTDCGLFFYEKWN